MSRVLLALVVIALVASAAFWWWAQRATDVETAVVERGSIDVTIETVGTIQAPGAAIARAAVAGTIETLGVSAGDEVASGDIVAIFDRRRFERALDDAEAALTRAEYALQLAESRSEETPDDQSLRLEALAAAQRVEEARRAVEDAQTALDSAVILAPEAGTVIELPVSVGDSVGAEQPIARIAGETALRLVAEVDELDLPNVGRGASVEYRLDAYPERELGGTVVSTAPQARLQGGATVFATTIEIEVPADLDVRPGMNADVTIVTASREGVLLIPERALRTVGERSFVRVQTNGGDEEREVVLGYRSEGHVEVVDGLVEGDVVVLR